MTTFSALVRLPFRLIRRFVAFLIAAVAAATGTALAFAVMTALLLTLNTATLLSSTVFNLLSGATEIVFNDSVRKRNAATVDRVRTENVTIRRELDHSQRELANSRRQLASSQRELSRSQRETVRVQGELRANQIESERLRRDLRASEVREVRLRNQLEAKRIRSQTIAKRIRNRTANAAAVNAGAVLGEALPLIGISVIVAATAYELNAACATMHDMDQLMTILGSDEEEESETGKVCGLMVPDPKEIWSEIVQSPRLAWQKTQDGWTGLSERIPHGLPQISAPAAPEALLGFWERLTPRYSSKSAGKVACA